MNNVCTLLRSPGPLTRRAMSFHASRKASPNGALYFLIGLMTTLEEKRLNPS
jgi:hypothetical protein